MSVLLIKTGRNSHDTQLPHFPVIPQTFNLDNDLRHNVRGGSPLHTGFTILSATAFSRPRQPFSPLVNLRINRSIYRDKTITTSRSI